MRMLCTYDPYVPEYREHGMVRRGEEELTAELLQMMDLVIITTMHSNVDYDFVQIHAKMIFDTKNAMKNAKNRKY